EVARRPTAPGGGDYDGPMPTRLPEIGDELAGYKIEGIAGRGGMGVVFRAEHMHLNRVVALKVLTADLAGNRSFRQRFIREAQTAARLDHPNIVPVFDAGEEKGLLYIAMKFIDGVDLGHVLDAEERLSPQRTVDLLTNIADALDVAHGAGLVHRDVKPGNVLVDNVRSYLTDFGLTKRIASRTALTAAGRTVGTAAYLAPEQIRGQDVDARTDLYAFACVLYECLTGAVPFTRDTDMAVLWAHLEQDPEPASARVSELPKELDPVFASGLAKRKEDRFTSCGELMKAVAEATNVRRPASSSRNKVPVACVLVASADRPVRSLVEATLAEGRLSVSAASDAERALDQARANPPQLAFVDADVPGGAIALCQRLRATEEAAATRIVMLVGRGVQVDRAGAKAAGVDDFLAKPFSSLQLMAKVRDFVPDALAG
ncbi:MAG: serine/threonine protein kinase, bacterial, partial [Thermoleophilaceae bacterium]|nr:serine/threonine protein kinase, bacterial [Thermoleophilaceae bacterium]